jgi:phospholipid/cholesterol/gamma-HCH transport system substrate-binding protein
MPNTTSWRDLRLGLFALFAVIAGGAAVLLFARVGALRGDTFTIYAATNEARGILPGSEVWLAGQKIGLVRKVEFRSVATDTANRLLLELQVLAPYQPHIRRDAVAQIRAGTSLIGAPVVYISSGDVGAPALAAGDTILSRPQDDREGISAQVAIAGESFPVIIDNVKVLGAQLQAARGTLGAIGLESYVDRAGATGSAVVGLVDRTMQGNGTVGLALRRQALASRVRLVLARTDSVRTLVTAPDPRTTIGRFRRDSTLWRTVDSLRVELALVNRLLAEPRGTAGRVLHDSALVQQVARSRRELDALLQDFARNPLRYVAF